MLIALQALQGKVMGTNYDLTDLPKILQEREREINDLTERSLLKRVQDNPPAWDIFCPVFQWWILKEIEAENPQQLEQRRKVWANLLTQKRVDQVTKKVEWIKKNHELIKKWGERILVTVQGM